MWEAILSSRPVRWLAGGMAALLALLGIIAHQRRDAASDERKEIEHEYQLDTISRVEAGRVALRDAGDGSADDRVSGNDSKW